MLAVGRGGLTADLRPLPPVGRFSYHPALLLILSSSSSHYHPPLLSSSPPSLLSSSHPSPSLTSPPPHRGGGSRAEAKWRRGGGGKAGEAVTQRGGERDHGGWSRSEGEGGVDGAGRVERAKARARRLGHERGQLAVGSAKGGPAGGSLPSTAPRWVQQACAGNQLQ